MPIVATNYRAHWFYRNPHISTIIPNQKILPRMLAGYDRERWELEDGDFLDLDWKRNNHPRVLILMHGLEGSTDSNYMHRTTVLFHQSGWDVCAFNFRSCSEEINRHLKMYHHGDTADLIRLFDRLTETYAEVALLGFSLGGNVTVRFLAEEKQRIPSSLRAAVVSVPCDTYASSMALDSRQNWIYRRMFRKLLWEKLQKKHAQYPDAIPIHRWKEVKTFKDFDDIFTCSIYPFKDAIDYYNQGSANSFLDAVENPLLMINSKDDTFLDSNSFPYTLAERMTNFFLEVTEHGGHVGFVLPRRPFSYAEYRVLAFLEGRFSD